MGRNILFVLALCVPIPAGAQVQAVVVPSGSAVVIAPRGQAPPRASMAPPRPAQRRMAYTAPGGDTLAGPTAAIAAGLAGAAALAVILGGGTGGGSSGAAPGAPSRTR